MNVRVTIIAMSILNAGAGLCAAPALDFDRGGLAPDEVIAGARATPAPALKAQQIVPADKAAAPAPTSSNSLHDGYRVVESVLQGGVEEPRKETICLKEQEGLSCVDGKTLKSAPTPEVLDAANLKQIIAEAMASASAADPVFRVAHDYEIHNGRSKYWCYGIWEDYGCQWVTRKITLGTGGVNWETKWECAGRRETGHHCDCTENCN